MNTTPSTNQYLRPEQAYRYLGVSRSTLYAWMRDRPDFPKGRRLSARCTVFDMRELDAFVNGYTQPAKVVV